MRKRIRFFNRLTIEIIFIISGLAVGLSSQLQWFTNQFKSNKGTLYEFAANGGWQDLGMTTRVLLVPVLTALGLYSLNWIIRFLLFKISAMRDIKVRYLKYDKLLYAIFILSLLFSAGFKIGGAEFFFLFLFLFAAAQVLYIYKLVNLEKVVQSSNSLLSNRLVLILFSCSGFAALIYQIVWQRALFQAFGVNIESVTIIVSIFMLGLGIGSLTGGILSKKYPQYLLQLFVICEIIIGVFGLFSLEFIDIVTDATINSSLLSLSLMTYGLLFIPTMFMGATLPILVSYLYSKYKNVGQSLSILYFINTLGSAIACFATAYVIFLVTGLKTATYIAALINFLIVFLGFKYLWKEREQVVFTAQEEKITNVQSLAYKGNLRYFVLLFVSLAVGYVSLSQEILWFRLISFTTGAKATVFPTVLGFFLIGIAAGSYKAKSLCLRYKDRILNLISLFIILSSLAYFTLIPIASWLIGTIGKDGIILLYLGIAVIAFLTGAVFPMLAHHAITSYKHVGFSMSWLYFFNIIGATCGSIFTGFFMLGWFTIEQNILIISVSYFLFGVILWMFSKNDFSFKVSRIIGVSIVALVLFSSHSFLYSNLLEKLYYKIEYQESKTFKYTRQSREGIINVIEAKEGDDIILGGGVYDGRFNTDLVHNRNIIDRAYIMAALHAKPKDVLEIGLSSGSWAKVIMDHDSVELLDVIEINSNYIEIIKNYPEQKTVLNNPKVNIFIDDGRRWLKRNPERKYDFILMNTTNFWRDQSNNLLSKEFLEICQSHLKDGGVIFLNTTSSIDIPYTVANVFQYVTRYSNCIAASDKPFTTDSEVKRNNLLKYKYHEKPISENKNPELVLAINKMAVSNTSDISKHILENSENSNLITDDNLASEFKTSKRFYFPSKNWFQLLNMFKE